MPLQNAEISSRLRIDNVDLKFISSDCQQPSSGIWTKDKAVVSRKLIKLFDQVATKRFVNLERQVRLARDIPGQRKASIGTDVDSPNNVRLDSPFI